MIVYETSKFNLPTIYKKKKKKNTHFNKKRPCCNAEIAFLIFKQYDIIRKNKFEKSRAHKTNVRVIMISSADINYLYLSMTVVFVFILNILPDKLK